MCIRPPHAGIEFHQEFDRFQKFPCDSMCKAIIIPGSFLPFNGSTFEVSSIIGYSRTRIQLKYHVD